MLHDIFFLVPGSVLRVLGVGPNRGCGLTLRRAAGGFGQSAAEKKASAVVGKGGTRLARFFISAPSLDHRRSCNRPPVA